ncbi:MAG TPA: hypothetical protein VJA16_16170 [Thermoanaerobaculia bacterium]
MIASLPAPSRVAIDGPNAYVASHEMDQGHFHNTLLEVPLDGAPPRRRWEFEGFLRIIDIAVRGRQLYFTQGDSVWSLAPGASQPRPIATGWKEPWAVATDATHVYFTARGTLDRGDGAVVRVPIAGGKPEVVAGHLSSPQELALDGANVYVSLFVRVNLDRGLFDGSLLRIPKSGGPPVRLAGDRGAVTGIAADGRSVYWTADGMRWGKSGVYRIDLASSRVSVLADGQRGWYGGLAIDEANVYWTNGENRVQETSKTGGPIDTLARWQDRPHYIAATGRIVVWVNAGHNEGEMVKLPGSLMAMRR